MGGGADIYTTGVDHNHDVNTARKIIARATLINRCDRPTYTFQLFNIYVGQARERQLLVSLVPVCCFFRLLSASLHEHAGNVDFLLASPPPPRHLPMQVD